ncbi:MAG: hypothetical protein HY247_01930 [archaeon]|nr:MAG: hypothetical protein HY247_01930 [archaeon]
MTFVDCRELTLDEQLALASEISDELQGKGVALIKDSSIVLDMMQGPEPSREVLKKLVVGFVSRRKDAPLYRVEDDGDAIIVFSADPIARLRRQGHVRAPRGTFQCPACGALLPDEGTYEHHLRTHDLLRGAAAL